MQSWKAGCGKKGWTHILCLVAWDVEWVPEAAGGFPLLPAVLASAALPALQCGQAQSEL